jgi:glycosyltransferase involved in cell wall biosynthesis
MKIGIDAKWYFEGPPSGTRVVKNLVDQILNREDGNEYVIFLNKKHRKFIFPIPPKKSFTLSYVWAGNNLISNLFCLPFFSKRLKLHALLYQNFISPWGDAKKVAYIHDVLFLSNPEFYTFSERLYFSPLKFLANKADSIITISIEEKKRLLNYKFSQHEKKIVIAYNGVDAGFNVVENIANEKKEDVKSHYFLPDRFLLYVGRLNLRKNISTLLKAIPLLKDYAIKLVIVGAFNDEKKTYDQLILRLGIEKRVLYTGSVNNEELAVIYSLSTLFCFPSLAEGFGLPPLEAMASGVPVVVSNTTSLPEVCGEAGNYVDPTDPSSIASVIDGLLQDEKLYAIKRRNGLEQAKKFTWENTSNTVIDCIEKTVSDRLI